MYWKQLLCDFVSFWSILQLQSHLYNLRVSLLHLDTINVPWSRLHTETYAVQCDLKITIFFRTAFKIQLPQMVKAKKKKLKQATWLRSRTLLPVCDCFCGPRFLNTFQWYVRHFFWGLSVCWLDYSRKSKMYNDFSSLKQHNKVNLQKTLPFRLLLHNSWCHICLNRQK